MSERVAAQDHAPLSVRGPARRQPDLGGLLFDEVDLGNVLTLYNKPPSGMVAIELGCARAPHRERECAAASSGKKPLIYHVEKKLGTSMKTNVQVGMQVDNYSILLY